MPVIHSVFLACVGAFLILYFPNFGKDESDGIVIMERGLMWTRLGIAAVWMVLQTIVVFAL